MFNLSNKKKLTVAITIYCTLLLSIIVIGQFDKFSGIFASAFSVFSPIIIGFTIAYLLNPILKFHEKKVFKFIKNKRALRLVGILFTYLSLCAFLAGIGMLVVPQVTRSISDLSVKFSSYKDSTLEIVNSILDQLKEKNIISEAVDIDYIIKLIGDNIDLGGSVGETIFSFIANNYQKFFIIPKNIILGFFISTYALFTKERIAAQTKKAAKAILKPEDYEIIYHRINFTHSTFGGYFTGVVIDAVFVGIITFIALLIFKVPYASLVAVLVAVTNVIPVFGPFLGSIPSAFIIFISDPPKTIIFILLILLIQQIDGNIIAPRILGNSTGMSSLAVIVAITVMGSCFGIMGMLIGVPVFAVIIAIIKEIIEEKLVEKGLPSETSLYYPKNSMAEPPHEHVSITEKIFNSISKLIKNIFKKKNKTNKSKKEEN